MLLSVLKIASAAGLTLLSASALHAQCMPGGPPNPRAVPRAIVGIVMDSAHQALDNVDVLIRQPRRQARTNARGTFQLNDLEPGTYDIIVRRIGFEIAMQKFAVTDTGGVARLCLVAEPQGLAPMVTSVPRGGLSGVIGDTNYAMVSGAEVRAMGQGKSVLTDSAGGFYLDLKKGTYAVVVRKDGYGQQMLSVTIPNDSGRRIAVWLGKPQRNANTLSWAIEGMRNRILKTPAHRYKQLSAEALAGTDMSVAQAVRMAAITNVADNCEAMIAGTTFTLPLYMIVKEDVAMIEVTTGPIARNPTRSINGMRDIRTQRVGVTDGGNCGASVVVWMKP